MANKGYADDDGSRTPAGAHDEGRQRETCYNVERLMRPATIADYLENKTFLNCMSDSDGDLPHGPDWQGPIDGNSNANGRFNAAAYPASSGTDGTG